MAQNIKITFYADIDLFAEGDSIIGAALCRRGPGRTFASIGTRDDM